MNKRKFIIVTFIFLILVIGYNFLRRFELMDYLPGENLVEIHYFGGMCLPGPCGSRSIIKRNGVVIKSLTNISQLSPSDLNDLDNLITQADFHQIESRKNEGVCAAAYDGSSVSYTFYKSGEKIIISECEVYIDYNTPLFKTLSDIRKKYIGN